MKVRARSARAGTTAWWASLRTPRWARLRTPWPAAAIVLVLAGSAGSAVLARDQSGRNADRARHAFASSSAGVASSLKLAIQHEEDLSISASSFVAENPSATNPQFAGWAASVRAFRRYPEVLGLGELKIVPASGLDAFARIAEHDAAGAPPAGGGFAVLPPGDRPFYCLQAASVTRTQAAATPAGYDFCAGSQLGRGLLTARDTGVSAYVPTNVGSQTVLSIGSPVYRGRGVPRTTRARRAAFVGWVGMSLEPRAVLARALADHPHTAVTFRYDARGSKAAFRLGTPPSGGLTATIDLRNGWTVRTFGAAPSNGIFARQSSARILLIGIFVSLLLGLLVLVLGTGRARALQLVGVATDQLLHDAMHDGLTGLPNRALITDRLDQMLARSRRYRTVAAALFVDLDGFKSVNDTLGHAGGDQLLKATAARLTTGLRDVDTIGRLAGDEFVVLVDGDSLSAPELVAQRLLDLMHQPFELEGSPRPILVTASVGLAEGTQGSSAELLLDADRALYQAKADGKDRYVSFRPEMETAQRHRLQIEADLRLALDQDQFRLEYQPMYTLGDLSLVGLEALLRWDHPDLGVVPPDEFISLLEKSGQILPVGRWVLRAACAQMVEWQARGSDLGVSVNVSPRQLDDDSVVDDVRDALASTGLEPARLTIEITETALMANVERTAGRLREIKDLGVSVAIDDFGTGYSSLALLQEFPVDTIKIDRVFTEALRRTPQSAALIGTLVQLGVDLGLRTLAEGVETPGQLDQLRDENVDEVQGFLFSKPLSALAVEELILPQATVS